ncbi:MAG: signal peptide peptidase SppA [Rhodospirillaceae bacterium]|nr:MAG: signal peptide peptidase SppA [Rhodospirillaceae bacterium]
MRSLGKILVGLLASIGFIVVVLIGLGIYAAARWEGTHEAHRAPDRFVLTLDLDKGFDESPDGTKLASLKFGPHVTFQDAVLALKRAKDDPRVIGVAASLNDQAIGIARIQEIRDLIGQIRAAGKPTTLFSESIGEGTGAMSSYYLASAFGDIWVQPSGDVGIAGIGIEQPFFKKLLDRIGVKASFVKRKEYKSAAENLTDESMSPANHEELQALLGGWFDQMVTGIAGDRKLTPAAVKDLVDKGPLTAAEAKDGGLIDHLGYRDEFEANLGKTTGGMVHVPLSKYAQMEPPEGRPEPKKSIAVITAVGEISRGTADDSPLSSDNGIKSAVVAKAIRDAVGNQNVAAIIIRIDSPGGSYVASDTIWREVVRAKQSKKPVIVSMGDVAASGGYFIAMAADRIFAEPGTITGSIGVLSGKIVIGGASDKLDVHWDRITAGESAGLYSSTTDFTPKQLARLNEVMDTVYTDFTTKAAQGRKVDVETLEKSAHGRVWSGADALKVGLVDELGGFAQALDYTKTQIGLKPSDTVWLLSYPPAEDPWEKLLKTLSDGDVPSDIFTMMRSAAEIGRVLAPAEGILAGTSTHGPQLQMAPVIVN